MKKVSTATRCEFGKFAGQRLTIGLDLGDRSSWYCILDERAIIAVARKLAVLLHRLWVSGETYEPLAK
jgi:hypothetical protein